MLIVPVGKRLELVHEVWSYNQTVLRRGFSQDLSAHFPSVAGVPKRNSFVQSQELDCLVDWKTLTRSSYARGCLAII
ncbi:rCG21912, isoform CRA_a [Rattus norvegicus]|uniref:RCG21912, isoform CRA_a n=1 Tax=Rattus norvegicus TaxID=10116 RepID=A6J1R1_RAT|nr:rCG21912, isoform CRA_a [Rattus norvegicus]EDM13851.1 rCG21912, isoform CRA_a [Rattus norvegicus]